MADILSEEEIQALVDASEESKKPEHTDFAMLERRRVEYDEEEAKLYQDVEDLRTSIDEILQRLSVIESILKIEM